MKKRILIVLIFIGIVLILVGIYLVTRDSKESSSNEKNEISLGERLSTSEYDRRPLVL